MQPGTPVDIVMTKWRDAPHWVYQAVFLGGDEHGDWVGVRAGTHMSRPGAEYVAPVDQVVLLNESHWAVSTFHAPGGVVDVYVDISTPPFWDGGVVGAVDLDLDVVRGVTGRVWVEDEDEFAEHRTSLGYSEELVASASASCERVRTALDGRTAPYDGSAGVWLTRLAGL
ncbi:DUF402 domain-containing protein [Nocardioides pacificus]